MRKQGRLTGSKELILTHKESKMLMRPVSGNAVAFSHVSLETLWVQGPSVQILIDLCTLSLRSVFRTSAKIEPLKGEYR